MIFHFFCFLLVSVSALAAQDPETRVEISIFDLAKMHAVKPHAPHVLLDRSYVESVLTTIKIAQASVVDCVPVGEVVRTSLVLTVDQTGHANVVIADAKKGAEVDSRSACLAARLGAMKFSAHHYPQVVEIALPLQLNRKRL